MTLCIAAVCEDFRQSHSEQIAASPGVFANTRVIACCDYRVEARDFSADTEFKFEIFANRWAALLAGPVPEARELLGYYKETLVAAAEAVTPDNALTFLRQPPEKLRLRLANSYTQEAHALTYADFLEDGKGQLPEELHRETSYAIRSQRIQAELILIGHLGGGFALFTCLDGQVAQCPNFAVVGSGSTLASSVLYQRTHMAHWPIWRTAYVVYEAKRMAEIAPGVGKVASFILIEPPTEGGSRIRRHFTSEEGERYLKRQFDRVGPKPIKRVQFPEVDIWKDC